MATWDDVFLTWSDRRLPTTTRRPGRHGVSRLPCRWKRSTAAHRNDVDVRPRGRRRVSRCRPRRSVGRTGRVTLQPEGHLDVHSDGPTAVGGSVAMAAQKRGSCLEMVPGPLW
jgi:hypothetical protein